MNKKKCFDHEGIEYQSQAERAKAYGKSQVTVDTRLKRGWTLEEALTLKSGEKTLRFRKGCTCQDHLGKTYKSEKERAKAYGKEPSTVKYRLDNGWTLRAALSIPSKFGLHVSSFEQRSNKVLFNFGGKDYKNFSCPICGNSYVFDLNDVLTHILFHIEKGDDI